jgi:flagellar motor protein MotB
MQLSAKALLKPFNTGTSPKDNDNGSSRDDDEDPEGGTEIPFDNYEDNESDNQNGDEDEADDEADEDGDEEDDPLDMLDEEELNMLLEDTLTVRTTLNKVYIYISTSLSLRTHI